MPDKDFSSIKAGDFVLFRRMGGRYQKVQVERVTPTGCIKVLGLIFNSMGYQIGGSEWHKSYIDPFDQKTLDDQAEEDRLRLMRRECMDADWSNIDDSLVAKIHSLLPKKSKAIHD